MSLLFEPPQSMRMEDEDLMEHGAEEMSEIEIQQMERGFVEKFISEVRSHTSGEILREENFYFDMFPTGRVGGHDIYDACAYGWWMPYTHSIAVLMRDNYARTLDPVYAPIRVVRSDVGTAVIYADEQLKCCIEAIVELCKRYNFPIEATPLPVNDDLLQVVTKKTE